MIIIKNILKDKATKNYFCVPSVHSLMSASKQFSQCGNLDAGMKLLQMAIEYHNARLKQ